MSRNARDRVLVTLTFGTRLHGYYVHLDPFTSWHQCFELSHCAVALLLGVLEGHLSYKNELQ